MKSRLKSQREKGLQDDARLLRAWKRWHREERAAALAGPHGPALAELFRMFDNIKHVRPIQLVGLVQSIAWAAIDDPTRFVVLHEANAAIGKQRERSGLVPFDDGLPGSTQRFPPDPSNDRAHRIAHSKWGPCRSQCRSANHNP
jgi:hypothetical protein